MGFGFVEVGTLTPRPQSGNPAPRVFRSHADRAVINRLGFNNEGQAAALQRLKTRPRGVVGVNLGANRDSADRIEDYVDGIARMAPVADYFTIIISNTTLARDDLKDQAFARETGGLSGRPLFDRATRTLARVYRLTEGRLPLIGVGGIDSAEKALAKIEAGASLIQIYTGLVFEGPGLIDRIKRVLVGAIDNEKCNTLKPLIGARAGEWAEKTLPEVVV
jgi:dihydroorotate dehydrogenase